MARPKTSAPEGYEEQRLATQAKFAQLPRGSQMQAAFDLRLPPITVSRILNGKSPPRPRDLTRLAVWAAGDPEP